MSEPSRRRYGDKEVTAIIKRAVEMQQSQSSEADVGGRTGVPLEHLQELAAEAGIDPKLIAAAAAEHDAGLAPDEKFHFLGAPRYTEMERIVEGAVPDDGWQDLAAGLRKHLGDVGTVSQIGQSLEWRGPYFQIWIASKNGQTTLRVRSGQRFHPLLAHVLPLWLTLISAPLLIPLLGMPVAVSAAAAFGALGGAFFLGRVLAKISYRKRRQALQKLLEGLTDGIMAHQPAETSSAVTERVREAQSASDDDVIETRTT